MLGYQRLDVYQCSVRLLAISSRLAGSVPRGFAELGDQLRRAAVSVPLNIAEASGRASDKERAYHFSIARGSAMECGAVLDALTAVGCRETDGLREATTLVVRIVEMLTKMCQPPAT
jgi:four helix bundle protein